MFSRSFAFNFLVISDYAFLASYRFGIGANCFVLLLCCLLTVEAKESACCAELSTVFDVSLLAVP